ncbi:hypothetical protein J6TS2_30310 [Heyndrickxia sporothermodurans]|nr:hypothetical protein J6TS2_30310 [Heyndrickxia sporothermodurans]
MNGLIFLFFIIVLIIFINKKSKSKPSFSTKKFNKVGMSRKISLILSVYIGILFLSIILYAFIPNPKGLNVNRANEAKMEEQSQQVYDLVAHGKIDQINPALLDKKWEKNFPHKQLHLKVDNNEYLNLTILVERKATNDDKVEGIFTKPQMTVSGLDITSKLKSQQLEWLNDTVTFIQPEPVELKFSVFEKEFFITQFTEKTMEHDRHSTDLSGQTLLYLRIPKDLTIVSDEDLISIEYIGD